MANRRMFSLDIVNSDAFLEMSTSAQALYFQIAMRADDDGFCSSPVMIQRVIGAKPNDLKNLIEKKFLLQARDGVVIVKHWWLHNTRRKDTFKHSNYLKDNADLKLDFNNSYTFDGDGKRYLNYNESDNKSLAETQQVVNENTTSRQQKNNEPLTQYKSKESKSNQKNLKESNLNHSNQIKDKDLRHDDGWIDEIDNYISDFKKRTTYDLGLVDKITTEAFNYVMEHIQEIKSPVNYFKSILTKNLDNQQTSHGYFPDDREVVVFDPSLDDEEEE